MKITPSADITDTGSTLEVKPRGLGLRDGGLLSKFWEPACIIVIFFITISLSGLLQSPISRDGGKGWDGAKYYSVADQFRRHKVPLEHGPYVYRVGTPFLVALFFPNSIYRGFKYINLLATVGVIALFYFWLRVHLRVGWVRVMLVGLFITQWHAPLRFLFYAPISTDPLMLVALCGGLLVIHRIKQSPSLVWVWLLGLIVFVGVLVREVVLILPVALLVTAIRQIRPNPMFLLKQIRLAYWIPAMLGIVALVISHRVVVQLYDYSFVGAGLNWLFAKRPWAYFEGWFLAFGPILVLPIFDWRNVRAFLAVNPDLAIVLVGFALVGWVGGSDTERLLYWSFPIVYVLIGRAIEDTIAGIASKAFVLVLTAAQLMAQRIFWLVPDHPNNYVSLLPILTPPSSTVPYLDLFSEFSTPTVQLVSIVEYLVLGVALLYWLGRQRQAAVAKNHKNRLANSL